MPDKGINNAEVFASAITPVRNKRLNARVTKSEKEWVDKVAAEIGGTTSDVIREALHVLKKEMEAGNHVV